MWRLSSAGQEVGEADRALGGQDAATGDRLIEHVDVDSSGLLQREINLDQAGDQRLRGQQMPDWYEQIRGDEVLAFGQIVFTPIDVLSAVVDAIATPSKPSFRASASAADGDVR